MTANSQRLLIGQFCDDIRREVGNKLTFVGCYADDLLVGALPVTLPQLAVQMKAITPIDRRFEKLTLRACLNSTVLGEIEVPKSALCADLPPRKAMSRWAWVSSVMIIAPLHLAEECELRVEGETEEGILAGTVLRVGLVTAGAEQRTVSPRKPKKRTAKR